MATLLQDTTKHEQIFNDLHTRYHSQVRKRILFFLRYENRDALEDVEQTVWLKVWVGMQKPGVTPTYIWLSTIARNTTMDFLRCRYLQVREKQAVRKPAVCSLAVDEAYTLSIEDPGDMEKQVEDRETIRAALSGMSEQYARVWLLYGLGYTYKEIMRVTGLSLHVVNYALNDRKGPGLKHVARKQTRKAS